MKNGIICEVRGRVGWLTLDRPRDGNRLTAAMAAALGEACEALEDGPAMIIVLRGRGRAFCRGLAAGVSTATMRGRRNPIEAVAGISKPVVAVLDGPAMGPGAELALAADLRIATTHATLAFPEVSEGRLPSFGGTQRLPRLVGRTRALEILVLSTTLSASEAAEIGLVTRVVAEDDLDKAVSELLATLLTRGPQALALAKEAVRRAEDLPLADGLRLEEDLYVLLQTTTDRAEGIRSFLDKRRPRFRGQ